MAENICIICDDEFFSFNDEAQYCKHCLRTYSVIDPDSIEDADDVKAFNDFLMSTTGATAIDDSLNDFLNWDHPVYDPIEYRDCMDEWDEYLEIIEKEYENYDDGWMKEKPDENQIHIDQELEQISDEEIALDEYSFSD